MCKLKIKQWLCRLSVIMGIVLFQGCGLFYSQDTIEYADFGFVESEQVVEVDADTKSFRIIGRWTEGDFSFNWRSHPRFPFVYIDSTNTTALDNVHFINHVDPEKETIGYFTPIDSDIRHRYRVVKLIPENIKDEMVICYYIDYYSDNKNLIDKHKVILRPKKQKN